ncbi:MAG TPA: non-ribosomal peptide synthetase, partial [Gemmatimonadaceae bacterium]
GEPATIVALLERQASRAPDSVALVSGSTFTRRHLESRANQLAHHLIVRGARPGHTVGVLMDRSAEAIVALVAVLKAGCAYMPLSVDAPPARLQVQMRESGASLILTADEHLDRLPAGSTAIVLGQASPAIDEQSEGSPQVRVMPDSIAYVLYTSGSTGVPKGVAVTHANVVHYARAIASVLTGQSAATALDALGGWQFGMASTLAADLGNTSLYPALLGGGTLHVLSSEVTTDSERFASRLAEYPLDVLKITPNHFMALAGSRRGAELAAVMPARWLVTGGEALRREVARTLLAADKGRLLNHYGPTETTVGAMTFVVTSESVAALDLLGAQTVPVGRPLANTRAYVVDALGNEQPIAVPGELWIGGTGVAKGYFNRDELTAERFVEYRSERVYRTGDRVRRLEDGAVEFLGRADDQVKVRGYRVEPGEVESALRAHPGVESGAVLPRTDAAGDTTLVAYVVPKQSGYAVSHSDRPTPTALTNWLGTQLPSYMVPAEVVLLETLPLTANGKVDRAALAAMSAATERAARTRVEPRTPTEMSVARIWSEVLKRDDIGVTESFLDIGGHSLLAIRVLGRISKELGVRLPLRTLFETPTVERVAALIDTEIRSRAEEAALREALAAVESMSDAEVAERLATEREGGD